jgi:flavin-dependent dehydrogenase
MRIAIVGAGVGGAYLANRLHTLGHNVSIFESMKQDHHWPICAWGTSRYTLSKFSKVAGLNFNDYILHEGKTLKIKLPFDKIEYFELDGLVTFDKRKWENDLLQNSRVFYSTKCTRDTFSFDHYDYVLDCTGFHRALLPKPQKDFFVLSYEYLVDHIYAEEDFYVICNEGATGYFWYFPLEEGRAFVGVGDIRRENLDLHDFLKIHYDATILKKIGRPVRLCPPKFMEPFFCGNTIGIGESIGCVFPLTGEGIIPTLQCCDLFLNYLDNDTSEFSFWEYRHAVLRTFSYYGDAFLGWRLKMEGKLNLVRHINMLLKVYLNMKRDEKRFGFRINLPQLIRIARAFQIEKPSHI